MTTSQDRRPPSPPRPGWQHWVAPVVLALAALLFVWFSQAGPQPASYTYTQFIAAVNAGQVKQISVSDAGAVTGMLTNGKDFVTQLPTALGDTGLAQMLQVHHVAIAATTGLSA